MPGEAKHDQMLCKIGGRLLSFVHLSTSWIALSSFRSGLDRSNRPPPYAWRGQARSDALQNRRSAPLFRSPEHLLDRLELLFSEALLIENREGLFRLRIEEVNAIRFNPFSHEQTAALEQEGKSVKNRSISLSLNERAKNRKEVERGALLLFLTRACQCTSEERSSLEKQLGQ